MILSGVGDACWARESFQRNGWFNTGPAGIPFSFMHLRPNKTRISHHRIPFHPSPAGENDPPDTLSIFYRYTQYAYASFLQNFLSIKIRKKISNYVLTSSTSKINKSNSMFLFFSPPLRIKGGIVRGHFHIHCHPWVYTFPWFLVDFHFIKLLWLFLWQKFFSYSYNI